MFIKPITPGDMSDIIGMIKIRRPRFTEKLLPVAAKNISTNNDNIATVALVKKLPNDEEITTQAIQLFNNIWY